MNSLERIQRKLDSRNICQTLNFSKCSYKVINITLKNVKTEAGIDWHVFSDFQ